MVVLLPANYTHRRFTLRRNSGKNWVGETPEGGTFTLGPRVLTQATFAAEMPTS